MTIAHPRGQGPVFFWVKLSGLSSHTSTDDHKLYRTAGMIENLAQGDPSRNGKDGLIARRCNYRGLSEARARKLKSAFG